MKAGHFDLSNKLLQTKLDYQFQVDRELTLKARDEVRQQLSHIIDRRRHLEDVNQRLISKANEIRHNLQNRILPTDDEYRILKSLDHHGEQMPLKDFIMVRHLSFFSFYSHRFSSFFRFVFTKLFGHWKLKSTISNVHIIYSKVNRTLRVMIFFKHKK